MASDESDHVDAAAFLYTGDGGERVPGWASRVLVDAAVSEIPEGAFKYRPRLRRVDLPEGLLSIGRAAFFDCESLEWMSVPSTVATIPEGCFQHCGRLEEVVLRDGVVDIGMHAFDGCASLGGMELPRTVRRIGKSAFFNSVSRLDLPDGVEFIGDYALSQCRFSCLRIPPLVTEVPLGALRSCKNVFSVELPFGVVGVQNYAFSSCQSLRNVALPRGVPVLENVFQHCTDLEELFGVHAGVAEQLRHRFNLLPIHEACYFQSYHPAESVVENLRELIGTEAGTRNPTGEQRDCVGMTPLHILCCSTRHNIELYQLILGKYPTTLIMADKWGGLPILYAFWSRAPSEVIQYLTDSHKSIFPNHDLNWDRMVVTLGMANAPLDVIQNLLDVRQSSFPDQGIDWSSVPDRLAEPFRSFKEHYASADMFRFLVRCSVSQRVRAVGLRHWRECILSRISLIRDGHRSRKADLANFRLMLVYYENEYDRLKVATLVLELALWKAKIHQGGSSEKREEMDELEYRRRCRISCGADNVIENILPFLLPIREVEV